MMTTDIDKLLALARECGLTWELSSNANTRGIVVGGGLAFIALVDRVRQEEREACVKRCEAERVSADEEPDPLDRAYNIAISHCVRAIRSSGTDGGQHARR